MTQLSLLRIDRLEAKSPTVFWKCAKVFDDIDV